MKIKNIKLLTYLLCIIEFTYSIEIINAKENLSFHSHQLSSFKIAYLKNTSDKSYGGHSSSVFSLASFEILKPLVNGNLASN
jgi:hypothetical protein